MRGEGRNTASLVVCRSSHPGDEDHGPKTSVTMSTSVLKLS